MKEPKKRDLDDLMIARKLAWLLDSCIPVPGTRYRIGLDPLVGLIPGLGDMIGTAMSGYLILLAANAGASRWTLVRMLINVAIEGVVGIVPFVGDFFDAAWKANQKNLTLLERQTYHPKQKRADRVFVVLIIIGLLGIFALTTWAAILIVRWAVQALQT